MESDATDHRYDFISHSRQSDGNCFQVALHIFIWNYKTSKHAKESRNNSRGATISATDHIGHNHIGHSKTISATAKNHIGHSENQYRPQPYWPKQYRPQRHRPQNIGYDEFTYRPVYIHFTCNELLSQRSWTETTKTLRCVLPVVPERVGLPCYCA